MIGSFQDYDGWGWGWKGPGSARGQEACLVLIVLQHHPLSTLRPLLAPPALDSPSSLAGQELPSWAPTPLGLTANLPLEGCRPPMTIPAPLLFQPNAQSEPGF